MLIKAGNKAVPKIALVRMRGLHFGPLYQSHNDCVAFFVYIFLISHPHPGCYPLSWCKRVSKANWVERME